MQTRRNLLQLGIASGLAPTVSTSRGQTAVPFLDVVRVPDYLTVYTEEGVLRPGASGTHWKAERVQVTTEPFANEQCYGTAHPAYGAWHFRNADSLALERNDQGELALSGR